MSGAGLCHRLSESSEAMEEPGSLAWGICKICENRDHARHLARMKLRLGCWRWCNRHHTILQGWMGQQGQQRVQDNFLWDFMAKRAEDVYLGLLGIEELHAQPE